MNLSTLELEKWLHPWPIAFRNRSHRWDIQVWSLADASKLYAFWKAKGPGGGKHYTIDWWARHARKYTGETVGLEQHYIHMLARYQIPIMDSLTIITLFIEGKRVVVDGNHHLLAAWLVKKYKFGKVKTKINNVGVVLPC